jgi:hypothetical protein
MNLFDKIEKPSFYVINIGASTGVNTDPVYNFIISDKFHGLCIEGDPNKVNILKAKTKFNIYNGYITPLNIIPIFEAYKVPLNPDILKIDIDGYDLSVLSVILEKYKPSIIIAEINEKIPPPIKFEVIYKENYSWDESHFFGFSLQSGAKIMNDNNYKILSIYELNNILCINNDLCKALNIDCSNSDENIKLIYEKNYINNLSRFNILPHNQNVNHWLDIKDIKILKNEIINYFLTDKSRNKFNSKAKIQNIDFYID